MYGRSLAKNGRHFNREATASSLIESKEERGFYEVLKEHLDRAAEFINSNELSRGRKYSIKNQYRILDLVSPEGGFIERKVVQGSETLRKILKEAKEKGLAILDRGVYFIPQEVWEEYRKRYEEVRENPKLSFEIFELKKLTRIADAVLIDLDNTEEKDIRRLVKYLHKVGLYPYVWKSASGKGYHIYIYLYWKQEKVKIEIQKGESREEKEIEVIEPVYVNDYRVGLIEKALRKILEKLKIKADFISANRAVWFEGIYNPLKGGSSELIWEGRPQKIVEVFGKLKGWLKYSYISDIPPKKLGKLTKEKKEIRDITPEETDASNPVDYIQANLKAGVITRLLNRGWDIREVGEYLRSYYGGNLRAFDKAWEKAAEYITRTFKPLERKPQRRERKHKHYWEHIPKIKEALKEGITTISGIAKKTGLAKSTVKAILDRFSKEQILNNTQEVIEYLKANQKGGNKLSKKKLKELGKQRWEKYLEQLLEKEIAKAKERSQRNRKDKVKSWRPDQRPTAPFLKWIDLDDTFTIERGSDRQFTFKNGRVVVGFKTTSQKGKTSLQREEKGEKEKKKISFKKISTKAGAGSGSGGGGKRESIRRGKLKEKPKRVRFYGRWWEPEKLRKLRPLIVGRRISADSWKLIQEAEERLYEKGYQIVEEGEGIRRRSLWKLIRKLYAYRFKQMELKEKPTLEEVLEKTKAYPELDLSGWGKYGEAVFEVLKEIGLVDDRTKVKLPERRLEEGLYGVIFGEGPEQGKGPREEIPKEETPKEEELKEDELYEIIFGEEQELEQEEETKEETLKKEELTEDGLYEVIFGEEKTEEELERRLNELENFLEEGEKPSYWFDEDEDLGWEILL